MGMNSYFTHVKNNSLNQLKYGRFGWVTKIWGHFAGTISVWLAEWRIIGKFLFFINLLPQIEACIGEFFFFHDSPFLSSSSSQSPCVSNVIESSIEKERFCWRTMVNDIKCSNTKVSYLSSISVGWTCI